MKRFFFLSFVLTAALHAQNPTTQAVEDLSPSQREFSNLTEEKRKEFIELYTEATRFFTQKRVFEALELIGKAEKIFPNSAEMFNLKGSCYVEMRIFDKAIHAFKEAQTISPNNASIMFNIAECMFVSKQWQEAHDRFQEVLKLVPANRIGLNRLVEFKLMLCKKKLGLDNEAKILADKYDYQDDSPFYYYAKAALAFDSSDPVEAEQWIGRANRIFRDPNILTPWQDTMIEYGYIKSFFASGEEESGS
jgi:tetratricopeptide (TPR) repeat protein